eukprot:scaffold5637_cov45-Phaeocystis_antarctica.AAC.1
MTVHMTVHMTHSRTVGCGRRPKEEARRADEAVDGVGQAEGRAEGEEGAGAAIPRAAARRWRPQSLDEPLRSDARGRGEGLVNGRYSPLRNYRDSHTEHRARRGEVMRRRLTRGHAQCRRRSCAAPHHRSSSHGCCCTHRPSPPSPPSLPSVSASALSPLPVPQLHTHTPTHTATAPHSTPHRPSQSRDMR